MKKRYLYILVLFIIIPLMGWVTFNNVTDVTEKYTISNETGDRKTLGNVIVDEYDSLGKYKANKISISRNGMEVSNADYICNYGCYKNIVENKDLLRGKMISADFIDEDKKYAVYACVENDKSGKGSYIDLNIKNKESGKIIRTKHYVKNLLFTVQVRVIENYVEVLVEGSAYNAAVQDGDWINSYKFDLSSGNLIKDGRLIDRAASWRSVVWDKGNTDILFTSDGENNKKINYMLVYDTIHEKTVKVDLPENVETNGASTCDGVIYCRSGEDSILGINEEGKVISRFKLDEYSKGYAQFEVNNGKIYFVGDNGDKTSKQITRRISVYSLENGKCLYSGQVNIHRKYYFYSEFTNQ